MAIFGWRTMKEAERYTRAARQKVLAASGMKLLRLDLNENKKVPISKNEQSSGTKTLRKPLK